MPMPMPDIRVTGLRAHARAARARFVERRAPVAALPLCVSRRRIYILPTRSGALFGLLLVVMLLGATNYENSLAFALTFWLVAIALVSMHHAHANLVGVQITHASAAPVFAGEVMHFDITLNHVTGRARRALRVSADDGAAGQRLELGPGESRSVQVACGTDRRGRRRCPRLRIESIYPIGLFRAWSWLQPDVQALVYARNIGRDRLPARAGGEQVARYNSSRGHDEFLGHRPYLHGDSPRHIDWKASARNDDLLIRETVEQRSPTLWLDEASAGNGNREARLSQLTRWVLLADRAALAYGLRLNDQHIGPDNGPSHRLACLRALALA